MRNQAKLIQFHVLNWMNIKKKKRKELLSSKKFVTNSVKLQVSNRTAANLTALELIPSFPPTNFKPRSWGFPNYNRILKWWHHKIDFSEIMGYFIQLFGTTYNVSDKSSHVKKKWLFCALNSWDMFFLKFKLFHTKSKTLI